MAKRARGNQVCAEPSSRLISRGPRKAQRGSKKDEKNNLRGSFKGKGLLKALVAEKRRESRF